MHASFPTAKDSGMKRKPENNDQCLMHMVTGVTEECFNEQFHIAIFNSNFTW